jgi:hypothetical protein
VARWCNRDMNHTTGLTALLILLAGCTSSQPTSHVAASPTAVVHTFAGGCAGTVLTDAEPPIWAQGGWTHPKVTPWAVPWALGTQGNTVAYVWNPLVAGVNTTVAVYSNKILWESKDYPGGSSNMMVEGRPLGQTQPVVTIANGGPSIVDVPTAGCWTFRLTWNANGQHSSTINLEYLPAGKLP